jgi:hypothetical protein
MSTAQIAAIASPAIGLIVYNTSTGCFEYNYNGTNTGWVTISGLPTALSAATTSFTNCSSDLITIPGLSNFTTIVWSAPTTICSAAVIAAANLANATSLTLSGGTGGAGVVTATITNACGNIVITTPTITCTASPITIDNFVLGAAQTKVVNITTAGANEIVLVFVDGFVLTNTAFSGSVAVTGGSASGLTQLIYTRNYESSLITTTNTAIYAFIANTAATYTITVTEAAASGMKYYTNAAIALKGFCSTPTIAGNIITAAATTSTYPTIPSTMTNSNINPTVANSYIVANFCSWENVGAGTITWPAPAGNVALGSQANSGTMDVGYCGYSDPGTGAVTFTVQDLNGATANIANGNLQVIDVHN